MGSLNKELQTTGYDQGSRTVLLGRDLYITQFDTDIAWYSILGLPHLSHAENAPPTSLSTTMESAQDFGLKITRLALEKGALISSLDPTMTSYPIIGHVIFTVRFIAEPKVNYIGRVSRAKLIEILKNKPNSEGYNITVYVPDWMSSGKSESPRYILHSNSYSKLTLIHIKLIKTTAVNEHTAFCLFNALATARRLKLEHIQLVKELLSNGDGKSFSSSVRGLPSGDLANPKDPAPNLKDPFYDEYLKLKSKYMLNKRS
jgi:hypothetical protein